MDDDRKKTEEITTPDAEVGGSVPAADAAAAGPADVIAGAAVPGPARDAPDMAVSDELRQAMDEAAAVVEGPAAPAEPQAFDPNLPPPAPAEAPPELSKKELELKMQILDLRQQLREKDKEIEQRVREVRQNADQARMLQSQFEGFKVRAMKEKADQFNYGHEPLLKELLQVADNLERALAHGAKETDPAALCGGVELIQRQLISVLAKFGATPLESLGQLFNPELHQAMNQVEDDSVPPGTVVEEYQKGYRLKDRLLRPAMVLVSRPSADAGKTEDQDTDGD